MRKRVRRGDVQAEEGLDPASGTNPMFSDQLSFWPFHVSLSSGFVLCCRLMGESVLVCWEKNILLYKLWAFWESLLQDFGTLLLTVCWVYPKEREWGWAQVNPQVMGKGLCKSVEYKLEFTTHTFTYCAAEMYPEISIFTSKLRSVLVIQRRRRTFSPDAAPVCGQRGTLEWSLWLNRGSDVFRVIGIRGALGSVLSCQDTKAKWELKLSLSFLHWKQQ